MQYIKGVNIKQNDEAYLRGHFEEEDDETVQKALKGVSINKKVDGDIASKLP